jgi:DNA-binding PadR family transcriptional regulator
MNKVARHHRLRITTGLTWRAEYVLGILEEEGECKTQYLRHLGVGYDIIDTLNKLEKDGYIKIKKPNYSLRLHSLTDLGKEYLAQVELIYDDTTRPTERRT